MVPPSTTEAAVSSHEVSMPRTRRIGCESSMVVDAAVTQWRLATGSSRVSRVVSRPGATTGSGRTESERTRKVMRKMTVTMTVTMTALCTPMDITMHTMGSAATAKVSHRGQVNLPAELRHRWGIADGGDIAIIDMGDAALIIPGGMDAARAELRRVLADGAYGAGLAAIDDPDLAV